MPILRIENNFKKIEYYDVLYYKAIVFATKNHHNSYDKYPYIYHLLQVEEMIMSYLNENIHEKEIFCQHEYDFQLDKAILKVAAILHDIIEDNNTISKDILSNVFSEDISELVYAVTNENSSNRIKKFEKTATKICGNPMATALKLADRMCNYSYCIKTLNKKLLKMYANEANLFRELLYVENYKDHYILAQYIKKMWEDMTDIVNRGEKVIHYFE